MSRRPGQCAWRWIAVVAAWLALAACNPGATGEATGVGPTPVPPASGLPTETLEQPAVPSVPLEEGGGGVAPVGGTPMPVPIELPTYTAKDLRFPKALSISCAETVNVGPPESTVPVGAASSVGSMLPADWSVASPPRWELAEANTTEPVAANSNAGWNEPAAHLSALAGARAGILVGDGATLVEAVNRLVDRYLQVVRDVAVTVPAEAAAAALPTLTSTTAEGTRLTISFAPWAEEDESALTTTSSQHLELSCGGACAATAAELEAGRPLCFRVWATPTGETVAHRFLMGRFTTLPTEQQNGAGCFRAASAPVLMSAMVLGLPVSEAELFANDQLRSMWRFDQSDPTDRQLEGYLRGNLGATAAMAADGGQGSALHVVLRETGPHASVATVAVNSCALVQSTAEAAVTGTMCLAETWRRDGSLLLAKAQLQVAMTPTVTKQQSLAPACLGMTIGYEVPGCPSGWSVEAPFAELPTDADVSMPQGFGAAP